MGIISTSISSLPQDQPLQTKRTFRSCEWSGSFVLCSNTFTRFTRSAAEEFHSHGDVAIPTPRVNAQVSRLNWWAEYVIHKTHTVAIGGEILGQK